MHAAGEDWVVDGLPSRLDGDATPAAPAAATTTVAAAS